MLELLIVIAIIAILASMLLPALNSARARARAMKCISNLKQWGMATFMYAGNNNDVLFPTLGWHNTKTLTDELGMSYYFKDSNFDRITDNRLLCPDALVATLWPQYGVHVHGSYGMSWRNTDAGCVGADKVILAYKLSRISRPVIRLLFTDTTGAVVNIPRENAPTYYINGETNIWSDVAFRHNNLRSANVLYFDGHVSPKTSREIGLDDPSTEWWDERMQTWQWFY